MAVRYDYLEYMHQLVPQTTRHLVAGVFAGGFRSSQTGHSMEFKDLRAYTFGDNVRDIDWHSTAKTGKVLVRRFVAERRRNILVISDTGPKMDAETSAGDDKAEVALDVAGSFAYLGITCGDSVGFLYGTADGPFFSGFHDSKHRFEMMMAGLDRALRESGTTSLDRTVSFALERIRRRALLVIVTDMAGLPALDERTLRRLSVAHDVIVVDVDDAFFEGPSLWDKDSGVYEQAFMLGDPGIAMAERSERERRLGAFSQCCHVAEARFGVVTKDAEVPDAVLEMLRDIPKAY